MGTEISAETSAEAFALNVATLALFRLIVKVALLTVGLEILMAFVPAVMVVPPLPAKLTAASAPKVVVPTLTVWLWSEEVIVISLLADLVTEVAPPPLIFKETFEF